MRKSLLGYGDMRGVVGWSCAILLVCGVLLNGKGASCHSPDKGRNGDVSVDPTGFVELFESGTDIPASGWITSRAQRDADSKYEGVWSIETASVLVGDPTNHGLVLKSPGKHHSISKVLSTPLTADEEGEALVVQYDVKLQKGLECGGAFIKLLTRDADFKPDAFTKSTPYTVMFGPVRCGQLNRVHFIFRHGNPTSNTIDEKHLVNPWQVVIDKASVLYTLIVRKDNSFEIRVNRHVVRQGSLLEDFDPPVNPDRMIDDPADSKPADWVDEAMMPDPSASKPDEWDEDEPALMFDSNASKPDDWLDDEADVIPDPRAHRPEDWDEAVDGIWVAPEIPNPRCVGRSGCGLWLPPLILNPRYRGAWRGPLIENPDYRGPWQARKIENPDYFEDLEPHRFSTIGAVGFDLWSLQGDIMFDNLYVGHSVEQADRLAAKHWLPKYQAELALKERESSPDEHVVKPGFAGIMDQAGRHLVTRLRSDMGVLRENLEAFATRLRRDPVETIKREPLMLAMFSAMLLLPLLTLLIVRALFAGTAAPAARTRAAPNVVPKSDTRSTDGETKADENDTSSSFTVGPDGKPVKRTVRKKVAE